MIKPDRRDLGDLRSRERTRESQRRVGRLLMEWDPIGVPGVPEAADEYDCMISPLLHYLFECAENGELGDWICQKRSAHFGLGSDDVRDSQLAERLTAWWDRRRTTTT